MYVIHKNCTNVPIVKLHIRLSQIRTYVQYVHTVWCWICREKRYHVICKWVNQVKIAICKFWCLVDKATSYKLDISVKSLWSTYVYHIAGNFREVKISHFLWFDPISESLFAKSFSLARLEIVNIKTKKQNTYQHTNRKINTANAYLSAKSRNILPRNFPLYGILEHFAQYSTYSRCVHTKATQQQLDRKWHCLYTWQNVGDACECVSSQVGTSGDNGGYW